MIGRKIYLKNMEEKEGTKNTSDRIKSISNFFTDLSKFTIETCQPVEVEYYVFEKNGNLKNETRGKVGLGFNHTSTTEYVLDETQNEQFNSLRIDNSKAIRTVGKKWMSDYVLKILSDNKIDLTDDNITIEYDYDHHKNWVRKTIFIDGIKKYLHEREIVYYEHS